MTSLTATATASGRGGQLETIESTVARISSFRRGTHPLTPRMRAAVDRDFSTIMRLLGPGIQKLTRNYSLTDMAEDAWQCCAIAVHRAIDRFNPAKAGFVTFATWQMRGELQSLRHRVRLDQRQSARTAGMKTVSMHSSGHSDGAQESPAYELPDRSAVCLTETGASIHMATSLFDQLWNNYQDEKGNKTRGDTAETIARCGRQNIEREIVADHFFNSTGTSEPCHWEGTFTSEQRRQIVRRVTRHLARQCVLASETDQVRPELHAIDNASNMV